jgi:hypothetical protein
MPRKVVKVEIVEEDAERVLLKLFDDGSEERTPISAVAGSKRSRTRPYWHWDLGTGRRKFF